MGVTYYFSWILISNGRVDCLSSHCLLTSLFSWNVSRSFWSRQSYRVCPRGFISASSQTIAQCRDRLTQSACCNITVTFYVKLTFIKYFYTFEFMLWALLKKLLYLQGVGVAELGLPAVHVDSEVASRELNPEFYVVLCVRPAPRCRTLAEEAAHSLRATTKITSQKAACASGQCRKSRACAASLK